MKIKNYVKNLRIMWENRLKELDNIAVGECRLLKQGMTCKFKRRDSRVKFTGTVIFSNNRCAFIVLSNCGSNLYVSNMRDVCPVSKPVMWYDYYKEYLEEE